jgi:hypothetical protein
VKVNEAVLLAPLVSPPRPVGRVVCSRTVPPLGPVFHEMSSGMVMDAAAARTKLGLDWNARLTPPGIPLDPINATAGWPAVPKLEKVKLPVPEVRDTSMEMSSCPLVAAVPLFVTVRVYVCGPGGMNVASPVMDGVRSGTGVTGAVVVVVVVLVVVVAAVVVVVVVVVGAVVVVVVAAVVDVVVEVVAAGVVVVVAGGQAAASAVRASVTANAVVPSSNARTTAVPPPKPRRRTLHTSATPVMSTTTANSADVNTLLPVTGSWQSMAIPPRVQ